MPARGSTFDTEEPLLEQLLDEISEGSLQLPDFQRGWVWDDEHIKALIASVSMSYPIGAVMILEVGGDARFYPRLIEGVALPAPREPERLILDGQQRLTSLFLSLRSRAPVKTKTEKNAEIERYYYLNMERCLDVQADRIDAVISVPADRKVRKDFGRETVLDLSTRELECKNRMFPVNLLFDLEFHDWANTFREHHGQRAEDNRFLASFESEVFKRFHQYKLPVIKLLQQTPKEAVCHVFEKVNTGGITLSVFELVTATYAAEDFRLRDDWADRQRRLREKKVLGDVDDTAFLTSATLLSSYEQSRAVGSAVACKKRDVMRLPLQEYKHNAPRIEDGLVKAAKLLKREMVFDTKSLPYLTQLIPLAAICAFLDRRFEDEAVKSKLARWLWSGVFGELYGGTTETRIAQDLPDVIAWLDGGEEPRTIRDANFSPARLLGLQTRNSAAYKGLAALLMQRDRSRDFVSGDSLDTTRYFDDAVDVHHVFPTKYCESTRLDRGQWNSVVNKTPLTARTNRRLGGKAPSIYIAGLEREHGLAPAQLDSILASHYLNPELLRRDDFSAFLRDRASRLLALIEHATGKTIQGRDSEDTVKAFGGPLLEI